MSHQPTRSNVPASLDFANLVTAIQSVDQQLKQQATRAVNAALTIRNWSIGYWIQEYEQYGTDRAGYGQRLLESLAAELGNVGVSRCEARELRRYRLFYQLYPQIWESLTPEFRKLLSGKTLSLKTPIRESLTPISGTHLIGSLSFTHICELLKCDSAAKREFYERECIEGTWSVRELRRQIASLYYERSELSINKQKLAEQTHASSHQRKPQLTIRDPYVFEFLGLHPHEVVSESHLESQLLDKLQAFLIELGQRTVETLFREQVLPLLRALCALCGEPPTPERELMITGPLRSRIDKLWEEFWTGGITNPLTVIEQISFLMFARLLDMRESTEEKRWNRTNKGQPFPGYFVSFRQACVKRERGLG